MPENKSKFQLDNGRTIHLVEINQFGTYAGVLEGVPTKELNQAEIESALNRAKRLWRGDPHLIEPTETSIIMEPKYRFEKTHASIPEITCLAKFQCFHSVHDDTMDYSELPVVWFQDEFAFPIADTVVAHLRTIDWDHHASDCRY